MRLVLVRHGESQGNRESRLQGKEEFPLTELGAHQAQATARRLSRLSVAALYSSPLRRALATAEAIGEASGLPVRLEPALQEYDFGELSGLTWQEINERAPEVAAAARSSRAEYPKYPGEEGREVFRQRVCDGLWGIVERHSGDGDVVAVTHAGPITVFLMEVLGRGYQRPNPFHLHNASLTTIQVGDLPPGFPRAVLIALNDTCHLDPV